MGMKKMVRKFLKSLDISYKVKYDEEFACFPTLETITIIKGGLEYNENEQYAHSVFQKMGIEVKHPVTYTVLHEAGHAVSFSAGRWMTNACMERYTKERDLLSELRAADMISFEDALTRYYNLGMEKDANQEAVTLFACYRKQVEKFDKKMCKKYPVKKV